MKKSILDITLKVFIFVISILLIGFLVYSIVSCINVKLKDIANENESGYVMAYGIQLVALIIINLFYDGALLILSGILLIISMIKKSIYKKPYIFVTLLPIICFIIFLAFGIVLSKM